MEAPYHVAALKVRGPSIRNFSYLVVDRATGKAAVVDPAWEPETIMGKARELGATVTAVLLTHSHFDHVNGASPLVEQSGADVFMSAREIDQYGFRCDRLNALEEGDAVRVGATEIACLLTPGHTAGGACYLLPDAMFTGDTIFSEGCGICTAAGGSPEDMYRSVGRIKRSIDPRVRIFPGHSFGMEPGRTLGALMLDNIYFQIEDRETFVAWRMRELPAEALVTR